MSHTLTAALLFFCATSTAVAQDLVLRNARIVDPVSRTVTMGALWIENGRIVGRGDMAPAGARGASLDLEGRWVIPGLVDLHTHSFGNSAPGGVSDAGGTQGTAVRVLRAGVTAFLDLFGMEDYLFGLRDRQRAGQAPGADIFAAGPCITVTRGHCSEYGIPTRLADTPDDARREIAELARKRPDVVKVVYDHFDYGPNRMPAMDRATMEALLLAAREHGLRTVVHVGTWADVREAVLAGADAVTHVARDGVVPHDVVRLMAERGTVHIPTLVVHRDLSEFLGRPELMDAPLLVAVTSEALRAAYRRGADSLGERERSWAARQEAAWQDIVESVRRLLAAGIPVLTGTDAGNWGVIQGYSVHREMLRLVEAGLSPWDGLAGATVRAGEFLGRRYGVRVGDEANLVVLDASPIEDIANTQRIRMVVKGGRVVFPEG